MGYFKLTAEGTLQSANTKLSDGWRELSTLERSESKTSIFTEQGKDGFWYAEKYNENLTVNITEQLKTLKESQIEQIKKDCTSTNPVTMLVDLLNGSQKNITFNGGDASAGAIEGSVKLADTLSETSVSIWDIDNVLQEMELLEALEVSANIGKIWRDKMYHRQNLIQLVKDAQTEEEIKSIVWHEV